MKTVDAIIEILQREKVEFLSCFPTTSVIDAAASAGMRPVICRQERVGVGIADGFARVTNGRRPAVFAMQYGPGAENAFAGVATAYSDSTPMLLIPLGQASAIAGVPPIFSSEESYNAVTKWVERLDHPHRLPEVMRRAFSRLYHGKPGPVMVEFAADIMDTDIGDVCDGYAPVAATRSAADPRDVLAAARALVEAERPVIFAGTGGAVRGGVGRARRAGGAAASPRRDDDAGQERIPGGPPAVGGDHRDGYVRTRLPGDGGRRRGAGGGGEPDAAPDVHHGAAGEDGHPRRQRRGGHQ